MQPMASSLLSLPRFPPLSSAPSAKPPFASAQFPSLLMSSKPPSQFTFYARRRHPRRPRRRPKPSTPLPSHDAGAGGQTGSRPTKGDEPIKDAELTKTRVWAKWVGSKKASGGEPIEPDSLSRKPKTNITVLAETVTIELPDAKIVVKRTEGENIWTKIGKKIGEGVVFGLMLLCTSLATLTLEQLGRPQNALKSAKITNNYLLQHVDVEAEKEGEEKEVDRQMHSQFVDAEKGGGEEKK